MSLYAIKENEKWITFEIENNGDWKSMKKAIRMPIVKKNIKHLIPESDPSTLCLDCNCPVLIYDIKYVFHINDFLN